MSYLCGGGETPAPVAQILLGLASCCPGAVEEGPHACSCWDPVYDLEQQPSAEVLQPGQRTEMCDDCAYRPDSPERNGSEEQEHSEPGALDDVARGPRPFWCHQGMRKPTAYKHATLGIVVPVDVDAYRPPMVELDGLRVPLKADGTAGDRCAGWLARRQQLAAAEGWAADVGRRVSVVYAKGHEGREGVVARPATQAGMDVVVEFAPGDEAEFRAWELKWHAPEHAS